MGPFSDYLAFFLRRLGLKSEFASRSSNLSKREIDLREPKDGKTLTWSFMFIQLRQMSQVVAPN
jgi:hypothetical protein